MKRRERAKFIISSDLLYGEHGLHSNIDNYSFNGIKYILGCPPRIPPKAWSLFIVELTSWIDCILIEKLDKLKTEDDNLTEDFDERIRIVQTLRDMGNVRKNKPISLRVFCV